MATAVEQYVLWLEVAVDDAALVQPFECDHDFCRVEHHLALQHAPARTAVQPTEQLAARHVVHDQVQLGRRLEGVAQCDERRVAQQRQDVLLLYGGARDVLGGQQRLLHHLQRVQTPAAVVLRQEHLAVAAAPDHREEREVGDGLAHVLRVRVVGGRGRGGGWERGRWRGR